MTLLDEVDCGKFPEAVSSRCIIGAGRSLGAVESSEMDTPVANSNLGDPSILSATGLSDPPKAGRGRSWTIGVILRLVRQPKVVATVVEGVSVSVIDTDTFRRVGNYPMHVNGVLAVCRAGPSARIPVARAIPLMRKDEAGIFNVDDGELSTTQGNENILSRHRVLLTLGAKPSVSSDLAGGLSLLKLSHNHAGFSL